MLHAFSRSFWMTIFMICVILPNRANRRGALFTCEFSSRDKMLFGGRDSQIAREPQGTSRNRQSCGIHSVDTRIYLNIRVVISRWPDNRRHLLIVAHIGRRNDKFYDCIARKRIREIFKFPALKLLNYVDQVLMSAQSANYCCGQFRAINSSLVRLLPLSGLLALLAVFAFRVHSAAISRSQILSASCLDAMIKS